MKKTIATTCLLTALGSYAQPNEAGTNFSQVNDTLRAELNARNQSVQEHQRVIYQQKQEHQLTLRTRQASFEAQMGKQRLSQMIERWDCHVAIDTVSIVSGWLQDNQNLHANLSQSCHSQYQLNDTSCQQILQPLARDIEALMASLQQVQETQNLRCN